MIPVNDDELVSLSQAARMLPITRGKSVSPSTLWRWSKHGIRGVRLETLVRGGTAMTTRTAIQVFFERLTTLRSNPQTSPSEDHSTSRNHAAGVAIEALRSKFGVRVDS